MPWGYDYTDIFLEQYRSLPEAEQNKIMRIVLRIIESPNPLRLESTKDIPFDNLVKMPPHTQPFPDIGYEIQYEILSPEKRLSFMSLKSLHGSNNYQAD